jgi:hypothetical protein
MKEIRGSSANLNKIWLALSALRSSKYSLPDPLPPPAWATVRTTRSVNIAGEGIVVAASAQLVPVVAALIDLAMSTDVIRDEISESIKETAEKVKDAKETRKKEETRWEAIPKGNGQGKDVCSDQLPAIVT